MMVAKKEDLAGIASLDDIKKSISKELKEDIYFGNDDNLKLRKLALGLPTLDAALDGGFAFDRISLLVGEFSTGKTLIAMLAIKAAQALGLSCAFIDVEKTWTPEWAETLGLDTANLIVSRPKSGESVFEVARALIRAKVAVIIIDSLAAIRPSKELESDMDQKWIGNQASLVNRGLNTLETENEGSLILCINQIRLKVGVVYGDPETYPAGVAQGYIAWQLVRVRRGPWIEEEGKRIGYKLKIQVKKNKQGSPFKEAEIAFYFTGELDELTSLVDVCIELEIIKKDRANYTILDQRFFGKPNLMEAIRASEDLQNYLRNATENIDKIEF